MGFVVMLKGEDDDRTLPIFIGVPEAQAIALHLNNVTPPRPMTHDLLKNVFDIMEGRLDHVEVYDLSEGTFYGRLVLTFEGRQIHVDSRPSDAIALALRADAGIFVAQKVMDEAGVIVDEDEHKEEKEKDQSAGAESEDPVQNLKEQLDQAVKEERYEDAAELRDEIKKRTSKN